LILGSDIMPVFRIEMSCDLSRVHQVAEKNRQMTPLTVRRLTRRWRSGRGSGGFRV
jgi:hypothetical protein